MKSVLGHCLAGAAVVAVGVALNSACVHNDSSLFVQDVLFPTPVTQGQSCAFSADPTQTFLPRGVLDVVFRHEYDPWYLVGNDITAEANSAQLATETSTINIEGAIVRITDSANNQLNSFTSPTSGTVYPAVGNVPGYTPLSATILDEGTVNSVVAAKGSELMGGGTTTLLTYVKFYGHTLGGTYEESNEFEFPIEICSGCLILFAATDVNTDPGILAPNCLGNAASGGSSSSLPVPCIFGQDTEVDCSQCQEYEACRGAYPDGPPPGFMEPEAGTGIDSGGD